jgi:hypothetical protein
MPIEKSEKIVRIVFVVILLVALTQSARVHASWASFRIRRGMTVNQALQVSGDWTWGHAHSERPAPELGVSPSRRPFAPGLQRGNCRRCSQFSVTGEVNIQWADRLGQGGGRLKSADR